MFQGDCRRTFSPHYEGGVKNLILNALKEKGINVLCASDGEETMSSCEKDLCSSLKMNPLLLQGREMSRAVSAISLGLRTPFILGLGLRVNQGASDEGFRGDQKAFWRLGGRGVVTMMLC